MHRCHWPTVHGSLSLKDRNRCSVRREGELTFLTVPREVVSTIIGLLPHGAVTIEGEGVHG